MVTSSLRRFVGSASLALACASSLACGDGWQEIGHADEENDDPAPQGATHFYHEVMNRAFGNVGALSIGASGNLIIPQGAPTGQDWLFYR